MTKKRFTLFLSPLLALCIIGATGIGNAAAPAGTPADVAPYNTYLFSLLTNKKSLADGKNHYQQGFDQSFDAMLAASPLAKAAAPGVSLKKRLLSGPQPEPVLVQDKGTGRQYVYYEACQAHACDETSLALLYAPSSKRMVGRLRLDGKVAYPGDPTAAEKTLLDQTGSGRN